MQRESMKSVFALIIALAFPVLGHAAPFPVDTSVSCESFVSLYAKTNLDMVAVGVRHSGEASVSNSKLLRSFKKELVKGVFESRSTYSADGMIYKGPYKIRVTVGEECVLISSSLEAIP